MKQETAKSKYHGAMAADFSMADYVERIANDLKKLNSSDLPDFLVLSPPRTGTTWLARALNAHKDIFIPPEKEVRYFDVGWKFSDIAYYRSRYSGSDGRLKGDASPSYVLLPSEVIRLLHRVKPRMKFIVMVRDLESRAWSNFRHSFSIGEFGLHSGVIFQGLVPEEKVLNYLISDYSLSVGDYREYLIRWLEHFPASQFLVAGMDEIDHQPSALLKRLYRFLGVAKGVDLPAEGNSKVNVGLGVFARTENVTQLLTTLYGARQPYQDQFLQETFEVQPRQSTEKRTKALAPVELINRADGYKVFAWNGKFHACNLEEFPAISAALCKSKSIEAGRLVADYYSEIVAKIEARKCSTVIRLSQKKREDARLLAVINELADDYVSSNSIRTNLAVARILREHKGFNVVAYAGAVLGLRQALGPLELGGVDLNGLLAKHGPENVVVSNSLVDTIRSIDLLVDQGGAGIQGKSSQAELIEQLQMLRSDVGRQLQELRARDDKISGELNSIPSYVQGALEKAQKRVEDDRDELASRLTRRQDAVDARLEDGLLNTATRIDEGLRDLATRLKQVQESLALRLSRIAPEDTGAPRMLQENFRGFNLIANDNKVWALAINSGAVDFADPSRIDSLRASGHILVADTIDGARVAVISRELTQSKKSLAQRLSRIAPDVDAGSVLIEQDYRGYNLVAHAGHVWAAEMAAGEIDLADTVAVKERLSNGRLLFAASVDGARAQVDRLLDRRAFDEGLERLGAVLEDQLKLLASRFESGLDKSARRSDERLGEMQARLQAVEALLEGRIKDLTGEVERGLQESTQQSTERLRETQGRLQELFEKRIAEVSGQVERGRQDAAREGGERLGELQGRLMNLFEGRFKDVSGNLESGLQQASAHTENRVNDAVARIEQSQQLTVQQLEARLTELERTWWQRLVGANKNKKTGS